MLDGRDLFRARSPSAGSGTRDAEDVDVPVLREAEARELRVNPPFDRAASFEPGVGELSLHQAKDAIVRWPSTGSPSASR